MQASDTKSPLEQSFHYQLYHHIEKIATNSLILQGTAYLGGHYLALLAGSAAINPLSLGLAGATFIFTRQSLFYVVERSYPGLRESHKTLRNVIKLALSLNAFFMASTVCIILTPLPFKALLITNLSLSAIAAISAWVSRYQQNKLKREEAAAS